jgi:hypothetical protein
MTADAAELAVVDFDERVRRLMRDLRQARSATKALSRRAGFPLLIELLDSVRRPVTAREAALLDATGDERVCCLARSGLLRTERFNGVFMVVAEVESKVLVARLPRAVRAELFDADADADADAGTGAARHGTVPLGLALALHEDEEGYSVRRHSAVQRVRMVSGTGNDVVIRARSRIDVNGVPVALTQELVCADFVRRMRLLL